MAFYGNTVEVRIFYENDQYLSRKESHDLFNKKEEIRMRVPKTTF